MNRPHRSPLSLSRVVIVAFALAGCQAQIHESGVILTPDATARIQPGVTTRNQVIEWLGPPTFVNPFHGNRWLYIQDRKFKNVQRTFSRVANRLEITFDSNGVVRDVQKNFQDKPWDPTTMPEANNDQGWVNWLWDRSYAKPATNLHPSAQPAKPETGSESSSLEAKPPQADASADTAKKPWWRFWSREPAVDPDTVQTMPPEDSSVPDHKE
ncbi:MAG: outer membrane protein assembly factor BamE [Magnetococcales bacterium]|nr:outer membrane protein assembly factor BamE [Magnetococcales bacterium]